MVNKNSVKIGLGETIITPKENLKMHGFARSQVATGVHDDLHSRCMIIEDSSGQKVVLLSVSLVFFLKREYATHIRESVAKALNTEIESVMLSCTHTHSGPHVEVAPKSYQNYLHNQIVKSAKLASENLAPGLIGIGKTVQFEVGKNRRKLLYGGVHPDPELVVIKIEDFSGKLRGVLFNYGCHPATLDWRNTLYSEDWPYYAIQGIKEEIGSDVWVCYLQAAQGDINTGYDALLSAIGADMPVRNYPYIEYKGRQMSESILKILQRIETEDISTVKALDEYHDIPLRKEFPVTIEEAEKELEIAKKELNEFEQKIEYKSSKTLDTLKTKVFSAQQTVNLAKEFYKGTLPEYESTEIQVFQIGDTVLFSLPGEIFSEIALAIKKQSPFKNTIAVGLANGYYAYMPTKEEFIDGNYEVDGSKFSFDASEIFVQSTIKVINKLKR